MTATLLKIAIFALFVASVWFAVRSYNRYSWFRAGAPLRHVIASTMQKLIDDDAAPARARDLAGVLAFLATQPEQLKRLAAIRDVASGTSTPLGDELPRRYMEILEKATKSLALLALLQDPKIAPRVASALQRNSKLAKSIKDPEVAIVRSVVQNHVAAIEQQYRSAVLVHA